MRSTRIIPAPARRQLSRLRGKSAGDVIHFVARKGRNRRQRRHAARRTRSPWMLATRLAEHPAVKYSVLSDPNALEVILNSEKGRELVRLAAPPATEPTASQFISILANQPERIAELLERDDVQAAMLATGVSHRVDFTWLLDALALGDPRAHDLLIDVAGEGVSSLLDDQNFRLRLILGLLDSSNGPPRLAGFLEDFERTAPHSLADAGYRLFVPEATSNGNHANGAKVPVYDTAEHRN